MTTTDVRPPETAAGGTPPPGPGTLPRLGWRGGARFVWTQLTSMRTALVLLFALALAAIPGSLVPQRNISPVRVSEFLTDHPTLGPVYDKLGVFHVYTSPWFSAIYLLLFGSLIGCIVPRVGVYARALRSRPPRTPRHLSRLPAYSSAPLVGTDVDAAPDPHAVLERAAASLRQQRYRVDLREDSVAAERGYLREAGNLVFHISLLFVLLGVAIGSLYGFRGSTVVVVGQGFANTVTQYNDLSAGAAFSEEKLKPFSLVVKSFDVKFETGAVQRGAARLFKAVLEETDAPGEAPVTKTLEVNHPLNINGTTVHLIGHGYAPRVTLTGGDGKLAFSGPVVFLPQDGNFTSAGAIKAPDARPQRVAFEGFFLPTAVVASASAAPTSGFPDAYNPVLFVNGWYGPPKVPSGASENVYSLDTAGMTQMKDAKGTPLRFAVKVGETVTLPNGLGTLKLDGWDRWVKLQVGDAPGSPISLIAIGFAVFGLCLSLFVRPRRIWVRTSQTADGGATVVEVGGLDRADARGGLSEDVAELAAELSGSGVTPVPASGEDDVGESSAGPKTESTDSSQRADR